MEAGGGSEPEDSFPTGEYGPRAARGEEADCGSWRGVPARTTDGTGQPGSLPRPQPDDAADGEISRTAGRDDGGLSGSGEYARRARPCAGRRIASERQKR